MDEDQPRHIVGLTTWELTLITDLVDDQTAQFRRSAELREAQEQRPDETDWVVSARDMRQAEERCRALRNRLDARCEQVLGR